MNSRERVLKALNLEIPDRVPWVEATIEDYLISQLYMITNKSRPQPVSRSSEVLVPLDVSEVLSLDNITFMVRPPEYVELQERRGVNFVVKGLIKTKDDLMKINFPNPNDDSTYEPAYNFLQKYKKDKLALASIRTGIASTYLSMGIENFSCSLYDDLDFVTTLLDMYSDWSAEAVKHLNDLGFDAIHSADDMAMNSGPMFSPQIFREIFLPRMKKVADNIKLPWIYHSDGDIVPLMDDLLTLCMNGIANIDAGAMDINRIKRDYGKKICIMGNIDLRYTLSLGTPEETEAETKKRIKEIGKGGGYILASENSLTRICKPENVLAMNRALLKYGNYPL